ncbi:MAG: hypothetical protein AAB425_05555, partial [Bdellovibrionota bacterium]
VMIWPMALIWFFSWIRPALAYSALPKAPDIDSAAFVGELRAADARMFRGIDQLLSTPIEPKRAVLLHELVDQVVAESQSVLAACERTGSSFDPTFHWLDRVSKGDDSFDARFEGASLEKIALRRRLEKARDEAERRRSEINSAKEKDKATSRETIERLVATVKASEAAVDAVADSFRSLEDERQIARRKSSHARQARSELAAACEVIASLTVQISTAARVLKIDVAALGTPPEERARGAVYRALDALLDSARQAHFHAGQSLERSGHVIEGYAGARKAIDAFWARDAQCKALLLDADASLKRLVATIPKPRPTDGP